MVEIYVASIDKLLEESCFEKKVQEVSDERRKKIDACKMKKDKVRSLAAGLLLQFAWKEHNDKNEKNLTISYDEKGKPVCVNEPTFHFNLSHSGMYAVCAVSNKAVGVDIQQVKKIDLAIAKRFFLPEEYERIQGALPMLQAEYFCKIWAGKESYLKYTGLGMKQMMNSFLVDIEKGNVYDRKKNQVIPIKYYSDIPDYQIAVCSMEGKFIQKPIGVTF